MLAYLSSYGLGGDPSAIAADRPGARAGLIFNALDGWTEHLRPADWQREQRDVAALGYDCQPLDLRHFWAAPPDLLQSRLAELDLVWVTGGNSFVLGKAMQLAGFGRALAAVAESTGLRYAGYSAGSCVAGPDLEGIALMDEPDVVPIGYPQVAGAQCLSLVPFRIVPHVDSDHPESSLAALAVVHLEQARLAFRPLRDGQALVVRDDVVTLVGSCYW